MDSVNCATRWNSVTAINILKGAPNCSRGLKIFLPGGNFATQLVKNQQGNAILTQATTPNLSNADGLTSLQTIPEMKKKKESV